ncbi:aminoacyl-histidine dipeptidase [Entamoeba histolytica HM-3:IMSS]|uniref:Aminoacyl-histidine dipeptidase n=1 Tax=Entamoeba histolytica HM-3:IMSS TaxID=885315 RepID=M7W184_ENTHI|nr:aminoacyl-histidine dipeptidase [Entamoeba histolytica HM-3:IMSS]
MSAIITLSRNETVYQQLLTHCHTEFQKTYWKWFISLSEIPRPSYHCKLFSEWILKQAERLGLQAKRDNFNNVCVHIPGSKSHENSPHVILQAHMDMVSSVIDGKDFDFEHTPITLQVHDTYISADGTTLGSDDGAGLACLLALMELHPKFEHAPIEALFTVDEEPGLLGAMELKEGELFDSAKYLINVDSEDWGEVCISSAGCAQRNMTFPVKREEAHGDMVTITLEGFKGGHTGVEIQHQRANALKWIIQLLLHECPITEKIKIVDFKAGHVDNAIPTKALMSIIVPDGEQLKEKITKYHQAYSVLYHGAEESNPSITVTVEKGITRNAVPITESANILFLLNYLSHGVVRFSPDVPDLVETSNSLSIAKLNEKELFVCTLSRSSNNDYLKDITECIEEIAKLHGGSISIPTPDVRGWPAKPHCHLVDEILRVYKKLYNEEMKVVAIHAGLENSIILNQYPSFDLESVSIGPTCKNVHTPDETMDIESGNKLLDLICTLLSELV